MHSWLVPLYQLYLSFFFRDSPVSKIPEELLKPSYLLLEPVRYTLAEILRLCRRPMVLPGPLVRSILQDLLGAVALCHDRNVVIKSLDTEKVRVTTCVSEGASVLLGAAHFSLSVNDATPAPSLCTIRPRIPGQIDGT